MSILPEYIIQNALIQGLRLFRENTKLLDMLFRNLTQTELDAVREFMRNKAIELSMNYPDQGLSLPSIVVTLKNDAETESFLGELQQSVEEIKHFTGQPFYKEELQGDQTVLGAGSTANVGYQGVLLYPPTTAVGGATNELWAPLEMSKLFDPYERPAYAILMEGTGSGQRRLITSVIPSAIKNRVIIEVDSAWATIPDATTIFKVVEGDDSEATEGEPSKLFSSTDNIERLGQLYTATYQLDINGENQETPIFLYNIVKAIFIAVRKYLIKQGLQNLKMSGSDLAPAADYFPTVAFRRSLLLEFVYPFDVYDEISEAVAEEINLKLSVHDPDVTNGSDIERIVSETEFDVP